MNLNNVRFQSHLFPVVFENFMNNWLYAADVVDIYCLYKNVTWPGGEYNYYATDCNVYTLYNIE